MPPFFLLGETSSSVRLLVKMRAGPSVLKTWLSTVQCTLHSESPPAAWAGGPDPSTLSILLCLTGLLSSQDFELPSVGGHLEGKWPCGHSVSCCRLLRPRVTEGRASSCPIGRAAQLEARLAAPGGVPGNSCANGPWVLGGRVLAGGGRAKRRPRDREQWESQARWGEAQGRAGRWRKRCSPPPSTPTTSPPSCGGW